MDEWHARSDLSFPTPGDLPDLGIEPESAVSRALISGFHMLQ